MIVSCVYFDHYCALCRHHFCFSYYDISTVVECCVCQYLINTFLLHFDDISVVTCTVQVTPLLLNLVMDTNQPVDIRIGAFVILRNSVPNYVTLQAIVRRLYNERASQMRTFIYTSLVSMTKYRGAQPRLRRMYATPPSLCTYRL